MKGLEPPRREALDPKSSVSTNFTTPACLIRRCVIAGGIISVPACRLPFKGKVDRSTNFTTPALGRQI